jgi:hypothetical protein
MLKRLAVAIGTILALLIFEDVASSIFVPQHICGPQAEYGERSKERCGLAESATYRAVVSIVDLIDARHDFVTAAATVIIAWFTGTIWLINRRQLRHSRKTERAYVSGGIATQFEATGEWRPMSGGAGMRQVTEPRWVAVTVDNHGKTPAFISEIAVAICPRDKIPLVPRYDGIRRLIAISVSPGVIGLLTQIQLEFADVDGQAVYGRVYYDDIFGASHSSGFIRQMRGTVKGDAIEAPSSYTEWD